jgi:hypothetical protein
MALSVPVALPGDSGISCPGDGAHPCGFEHANTYYLLCSMVCHLLQGSTTPSVPHTEYGVHVMPIIKPASDAARFVSRPKYSDAKSCATARDRACLNLRNNACRCRSPRQHRCRVPLYGCRCQLGRSRSLQARQAVSATLTPQPSWLA